MPNKLKKIRNTPNRVSNRALKSLENNFNVIATKNIISTPKIVTEKPQVITKPEVVALPKIITKPRKVTKPKTVDKSEIVTQKKHQNYDKYKNRVIRQLKHLFDSKKKEYIANNDEEYRGIRDLEIFVAEC